MRLGGFSQKNVDKLFSEVHLTKEQEREQKERQRKEELQRQRKEREEELQRQRKERRQKREAEEQERERKERQREEELQRQREERRQKREAEWHDVRALIKKRRTKKKHSAQIDSLSPVVALSLREAGFVVCAGYDGGVNFAKRDWRILW